MSEHNLDDFLWLIEKAATFSHQAQGAGHHFVLKERRAEPFRSRAFGRLRGDFSGRHVFVRSLTGPKQVRDWRFRWSEGTSAIELEFDATFEIQADAPGAARILAERLLVDSDKAGPALHALIARQLNRHLMQLLQQSEKQGCSLHDRFMPTADGLSRRRELDAEVSEAVTHELGVPLRIGFQMRDPAPRQIEIRCTNAFLLKDRSQSCEIVTTALLQFENFQAHKRSGLHDEAAIRAVVERQVTEAVKELLFGKRYYAVARAFAHEEDNAIRVDMQRRLHGFAQSIGYGIRLFNTLVDIPALALFRGITIELPAGEAYQLRSRGWVELSLSLQVRVGDDDEALRRLIGPEVTDPMAPLDALIRRCCRETLAQFDYSVVSVDFEKEVRPVLEARIVAELARCGLHATVSRLRSEPTEDAQRFAELCRLPTIDFEAVVSAQADGGNADEVVVYGVIDIFDLAHDPHAWLRFQSGNFGYRRDSPRRLDDMRAQARYRGVPDVDGKDRRGLAIAIEVAEIRERVIATLRRTMAMQRSLADFWTTAENAERIEQWASEVVASAIAEEFGLLVRLRGFGRRDTLSAAARQAVRQANLINDRDTAMQLAQKSNEQLLRDHDLLHDQRVRKMQHLDDVLGNSLINPMDDNHASVRAQTEKDAADVRVQVQEREAHLRRPVTPPPPPTWQPPPSSRTGTDSSQLGASSAPGLGTAAAPAAPAAAGALSDSSTACDATATGAASP